MKVENILCATDFSQPSHDAFLAAVELAKEADARLKIVHVLSPLAFSMTDPALVSPEILNGLVAAAEESLRQWAEEARRLGAPRVELSRLDGSAWDAVVGAARSGGHDLIVVGTHGRTGLKHALIGSVAENIVRHAPCSVLVVRPTQRTLAGPA